MTPNVLMSLAGWYLYGRDLRETGCADHSGLFSGLSLEEENLVIIIYHFLFSFFANNRYL